MTESELINYGWHKDAQRGCMMWRDPDSLASWYTFEDAVLVQRERIAFISGGAESVDPQAKIITLN